MFRFARPLARHALLLLIAVQCHVAAAQSLTSVVFNPAGTIAMSPAAGTVYTGELRYTFSSTIALGSVSHFLVVGSSPVPLAGFSGAVVTMQGQGSVDSSYVSAAGASCSISSYFFNADYAMVVLNYGSACTFTVRLPVVIKKTAGVVTGSMNPTAPRSSAPATACGLSTTTWAMWWVNGGCGVNYSAVSSSMPYVSIGCTLSPTTYTVNLPPVAASSLKTAGAVAGATPFDLKLTGCGWAAAPASVVASATWTFTPLGAGNNAIATGIANLGVQLLDPSGNPVVNGSTTTFGTVLSTVPTLTSTHRARYIAVGGAAGTGSFSSSATFNLSYN